MFTSGATEANNLALFGAARSRRAKGRKRVVTLATEHPQLVGDAAGSMNVALLEARIATTEELEGLIGELTTLEEAIDRLRLRRDDLGNDAYLSELQSLLLELALVQREIDEVRSSE